MDVRRSLSAQAQLLRSFCSLAQVIISDSVAKFGSSSLVASGMMLPALLNLQVMSSLNRMQSTSPIASLLLPLLITRRIVFGNQLVSGLGTNFHTKPQYVSNSNRASIIDNAYVDLNSTVSCYCRDWATQCLLKGAIYERETSMLITDLNYLTKFTYLLGMNVGCLPIESLLGSTLECYFDSACLRLLLQLPNASNLTFSPLDAAVSSRFQMNTTVEALVYHLFIETWNTSIDYAQFFRQCQPTHCTYTTITRKYSLFYIFNAILGFIGGLVITLRLLVPHIVWIWRRLRQSTQLAVLDRAPISRKGRLHGGVLYVRGKVLTFNLFNSPGNHQAGQLHGRISTATYIIFLSVSVVSLAIYYKIAEQPQTETVRNPDMSTFEHLERIYGDSLECPCSTITIPYRDFIRFQTMFHPICTSELTSAEFYKTFVRFSWTLSSLELNSVSTWYFQLLDMFCSLNNATLVNAQEVFDATEWIATAVPSRRLFDSRASLLARYYMDHTRAQSIHTLEIFRSVISSSQLMSVYQSSFVITVVSGLPVVRFDPTSFRGFAQNTSTSCSCVRSPRCSTQAGQFQYQFGSLLTIARLWSTPGIHVSCTPIDSLLQSTLECWYDQDCISRVQTYFENDDNPITLSITPMVVSTEKHAFEPKATIGDIVANLMLDLWEVSISYEDLFTRCAPVSCTYTYVSRNSIFYVISCVIALFGGLNMTLQLLTPLLIKTIAKTIALLRPRGMENGKTDIIILSFLFNR